MSFAAPAIPYIVLGSSIIQAQQQNAISKYNQAIQNRNAQIAEQEAGAIDKRTEFQLGQFDKDYQRFVGKTEVSIAKAGIQQGSGTALRIAMKNAEEAEIQKNVIQYEGDVAKARKFEESNFYRIQGDMARQTGRIAAMGTLFKGATFFAQSGAGSSLLGGAKTLDGASSYTQYYSNPTGYSGSF
jgi:hypothetical protein